MPLSFANTDRSYLIEKVGGSVTIKNHLENLGFVVGSKIQIITANAGNLIVLVKGTRVGISREMASRIKVREYEDIR